MGTRRIIRTTLHFVRFQQIEASLTTDTPARFPVGRRPVDLRERSRGIHTLEVVTQGVRQGDPNGRDARDEAVHGGDARRARAFCRHA